MFSAGFKVVKGHPATVVGKTALPDRIATTFNSTPSGASVAGLVLLKLTVTAFVNSLRRSISASVSVTFGEPSSPLTSRS